MEFFILWLPKIFCYLSGIIIAWNCLIGYNYINVFRNLKKINRKIRKNDLTHFISTTLVTVALILALFVFPNVIAQVMDLVVILESWYIAYLVLVTSQSTTSVLNLTHMIYLRNLKKKEIEIGFDSTRKTKII